MNRVSLLGAVVFLVLSGCSHPRTRYQPVNAYGGYSEADVNDRLMKARFSGNAYTHDSDAALFAQFRAIEVCRELNFKFARVYFLDNLTQTKTMQNSNTTGRLVGGKYTASTSTWNETYYYPTYDAYFNCTNAPIVIGANVEGRSSEDMKGLAKDLLGAVQIISLDGDNENRGNLQRGDLILKVENVRVDNVPLMNLELDKRAQADTVRLTILREGVQMNVVAKIFDASRDFAALNDQVVSRACTVPEIVHRPVCGSRNLAGQ